LAILEPETFQHELDRAQAAVDAQREVVAELEAGTRPQKIRQARAEVDAAQARCTETRKAHQRLAALEPRGAAARQQLDDARAAYDTAQAQLSVARAALDLAEAGPRRQTVAAARARLKRAEADAALAQWAVNETTLYAPHGGVIRQRILEPGDLASPRRPVMTLALTEPIWVRAYVDEPQLGKIQPGMTAEVTTDSYPGKRYQGWVGFISPTAEFTPKTVHTEELRTKLVYEVRVYVRNPRGQLRLGMPVTVLIPLEPASDAPRNVGEEALGQDDGSPTTGNTDALKHRQRETTSP
jgi:HlyD family secretion protein